VLSQGRGFPSLRHRQELITTTSLNFPNLAYIGGNLFLRSTKYLDCGPFQQLYLNGGIGGSFVCVGAPTSSSTASSGAPARTSSTPSSGGGLSAGAKDGIIVAAIVAGLAVIGIILVMRRKHPRAIGETTRATNMVVTNEPQTYGVEGIAAGRELWTLIAESRPNQVAELRGDRPPPLNSGSK
jgi:hypothetical protein